MTPPDLLAEAQALARPCIYLSGTGEEYAAVWGGEPVAASPGPGHRHRLSVDARLLPRSPRPGCLSIFTNERDRSTGAVVFEDGAQLPAARSGRSLFARRAASLPPLDAILRFGSPAVRAWLDALGWDPFAEYNDNFPAREPVRAYDAAYQAQLPLYAGGAHAVLGGWHFPWPDGDWADLVDCDLLVWTFEDAEPWVEAWADGPREWVLQRIT